MQILPAGSIADQLRATLDEIEALVDRTEAHPITITTTEQAEQVAALLVQEKADRDGIVAKLEPFSKLAFRIHRTITGKINEYAGFYDARIKAEDRALIEFKREQERIAREEEERLREAARLEDEQRRKEEAAALKRRAKEEGRPDLAARAEEIKNEPIREIAVTSSRRAPSTFKSSGGSVGFTKDYVVTITDEDALKLAVARPFIYREIARWLRTEFKAKGEKLAGEIERKAGECPQIPANVIDVNDKKVKANAKATNGRINWPGVAVEEDEKTRSRRA